MIRSEYTQFTSRGRAFVSVTQGVVEKHGWGSSKSVTFYPQCLEILKDGYTEMDLDWLVRHGWLYHYRVKRTIPKRNWRYRTRTDDIYGLTQKGWSVAKKYTSKLPKHWRSTYHG